MLLLSEDLLNFFLCVEPFFLQLLFKLILRLALELEFPAGHRSEKAILIGKAHGLSSKTSFLHLLPAFIQPHPLGKVIGEDIKRVVVLLDLAVSSEQDHVAEADGIDQFEHLHQLLLVQLPTLHQLLLCILRERDRRVDDCLRVVGGVGGDHRSSVLRLVREPVEVVLEVFRPHPDGELRHPDPQRIRVLHLKTAGAGEPLPVFVLLDCPLEPGVPWY
mmetsp:Transcript_40721/g.128354  ORF Transcript_40721/g.128354 Transcript_40721/m.128354 type:complete len:218 (-) Transcript_40721:105-758(-)